LLSFRLLVRRSSHYTPVAGQQFAACSYRKQLRCGGDARRRGLTDRVVFYCDRKGGSPLKRGRIYNPFQSVCRAPRNSVPPPERRNS
jgi:hypothetical protein